MQAIAMAVKQCVRLLTRDRIKSGGVEVVTDSRLPLREDRWHDRADSKRINAAMRQRA